MDTMTQSISILVIDDEEDIRTILSMYLRKEGYQVDLAADGEEGLKALLARKHNMVICDVKMPNIDGLTLLDEIRKRGLDTTVLIMSAFGSKKLAIEAIKRGAYDYFDKPFSRDEVLLTVLKASERLKLQKENETLRVAVQHDDSSRAFAGIIGQSDAMKKIFELVKRVATVRSTVLLSGESGTGKELVARAIHNLSPRKDGPWIAVNCGAIPETLIESELFGHKKGAFTDASQDKAGLFEEAHKGTLFLDEIAELPMATQVKLLRVIQEEEVRRVGANHSSKIDVRIIAASLHDLHERVEQGLFREDLFYRLNVINIKLPSLRERLDDLDLLIDHFIGVQNAKQGTSIEGLTKDALKSLKSYSWPGNVRELQNAIERGAVLSMGSHIELSVLPDKIRESTDEIHQLFQSDEQSIKKMTLMLERILIRRALEKTKGNRSQAARLLEISHRALLYKLKDYDLDKVKFD